jgi:GNAT superfamily N-acetyltransferase
MPPAESRIETELHVLDRASDDSNLIAEVEGDFLTSSRFERGEKCFAALHEGGIVSSIWGARGIVGVEEINMSVQPGPAEIYLYDAFTLAPWRGNNLYPAVLRSALEYAQGLDLSRAMIFVDSENTASRRGITKAGFVHFQTLKFSRYFGFPRSELPPPLEGHPSAVFVR